MPTTNQQGSIKNAKNNVAKQRKYTPREQADAMLTPLMDTIKDALPKGWDPERFKSMVSTAAGANPKLLSCTPASFVRAAIQAAQAGVEPNTAAGQAYLIPYKGEVTFQLSYKGLVALAYRSGQISIIDSQTVYEKDEFDYELGLEPHIHHKPYLNGPRGNAIAYYAVFHTTTGGRAFKVMSKPEVTEFARKKSPAFSSGPWRTDFDAMAQKTVLKQLLKLAPTSTEYMKAAEADEHRFSSRKIEDVSDIVNIEYEEVEFEEEIPAIEHQSTQIPEDWADMYVEDPLTGELIPKDESKEKVKA